MLTHYSVPLLICIQKQQVSIIEGLCKGHGCLNRTEIITLTAILKSANIFKDASNALAEKEIHFSFSQGEDFSSDCRLLSLRVVKTMQVLLKTKPGIFNLFYFFLFELI